MPGQKSWSAAFPLVLAMVTIAGMPARFASAEEPTLMKNRADKLMNEGNFKDAFEVYKAICLDKDTPDRVVAETVPMASSALQILGLVHEIDPFLEDTAKAHSEHWRALQAVAQNYLNIPNVGFIVSGKYDRGWHRGGGKFVNSDDRDRVRALQLYTQAMPLALKDDDKPAVGQFFLSMSGALLHNRGYAEAWRFQTLTDLATLPDYEEGHWQYRPSSGAPVDAEGNPVFHKVGKSWEASETDGERWRWAQMMAAENHPVLKPAVDQEFAQFCQNQFGVETLANYGFGWFFGRAGDADDKKDESGTYALHTLADEETICKLATGVKRLKLPDEFNYIKLWRKIADGGDKNEGSYADQALQQLARAYENRRQYPTAAKVWRESVGRYGAGPNNWRQQQIEQIVSAWGMFETTIEQPAGEGAKFNFRFRNARSVSFEAHPIDVEKLLADAKAHLKSDPQQLDWNAVNIENIGWQLVQEDNKKYVLPKAAEWKLDLEPRENHFDKITTVTTPLQKAGLYLVTANVDQGNVSKVMVWVADTVIAVKTLDGKRLYYVADAVTGNPIANANLEFFGFQQEHVGNGRFRTRTANFAEKTNADGMITPDPRDLKPEFQWSVVARAGKDAAAKLAFTGFRHVWYGERHDQEYDAIRTFVITDRPVYRPKQKVQFKLWVRHAKYDQPDTSDFANQTFPVQIMNPEGQEAFNQTLTADEYGGLTGEYEIPADAKLGVYQIVLQKQVNNLYVSGGNSFRIEEYKKPEYEVTIDAPTDPVMLGEKITAKINAKYYFGSPVSKAKVKYKVTRSSYTQDWYPIAPWDWCYGPGYWWFACDTPWYRGWNEWCGCRRPAPFWIWRGPTAPPEIVAEAEVDIAEDGTIEVPIDTTAAKEMHGDSDHSYEITAEVRDESRRTIVGTGKVLVARKPFRVFTWLGRGYYQAGQKIEASFKAQTLDNKPVSGQGKLTLLKITYDPKKQPIETAIESWDLDTDVEGTAEKTLQAVKPGQYRLSYKVKDSVGHEIEGGYLFTIVGKGFDGRGFRFNPLELIPEKREYNPGEKLKLQVNAELADSTVLLFIRPTNGVYLAPKVIRLKGKSALEEIEIVKKDMPNFFIEALTIAGAKIHTDVREVVVPPEKRILNVEVTPSAKEYLPGEKAKVKIRLTDPTGENFVGQIAATMYDKSVEQISGGSNVPDIKEFFWKWRRQHNPQTESSLGRHSPNMVPPNKLGMSFLGVFGASVASDLDSLEEDGFAVLSETGPAGFGGGRGGGMGGVPMMAKAGRALMAMEGAAMPASAPMDAAAAEDKKDLGKNQNAAPGQAGGGGGATIEPTVRSNFADTAKWIAAAVTDKTGVAEFEVDMPENLTSWKIKVWGMGHGTKVGSADVDVVTRKNLIVRLQAPRFFVQKDEVVLSANVHNYLPTEKEVTVVLETPGEILKPPAQTTVKVTIPAGGEKRVDWRCSVANEGEAVVRMKALTDIESDAVEMKFPSYVHGMLKTESWAGTVRPDKEKSKISINVPKERRPAQTVLEVRYSPSLAGAMVDALPYLAEYPYGCTEQTLNRFVPTVITQKVLRELDVNLEEIKNKRTNLNAQEIGDDLARAKQWKRFDINPVFDPAELDRMVREGIKTLNEMQMPDGGWGWFGGVREQSWPHTTAVVVRGLLVAQQNDAPLVPGVLERGVEWLVRYQADQLALRKAADLKPLPQNYKTSVDALDALVYAVLTDAKAADSPEMAAYLYKDRNNLSVYAKALFAMSTHARGGQAERLAMLTKNIEQFLVQDAENETAYLRLPEGNFWWYWHGDEIEANAIYLKLLARTDAHGEKAPRLVKYLLNNRKHATYWKSTRDTALCVEAFADYLRASGEEKPAMTVEVWVDGEKKKEVAIDRTNLFTFDNKLVLTGADVADGPHDVEIRRKGKGSVYFNAYLTNFTLEDRIANAGLEVKVTREFYRLKPVDKKIDVAGARGQALKQKVEKFEREKLADLAEIKSGDLVEVELSIESKNDYEYILFEDMKASGFEPVEVRSGYNGNEMGAYVEFRDERVSFFVRQLARGKHSLSYRLRAEAPGQFSALPAKASAMYAPELKGNSDEMKIRVSD